MRSAQRIHGCQRGKCSLGDGDEVGGFRARQRLDLAFRLVAAAQVSPEPQRRIRRQLLVLDRLRQHGAERPRDALTVFSFRPFARRSLTRCAAIRASERATRADGRAPAERGVEVLRVERDR